MRIFPVGENTPLPCGGVITTANNPVGENTNRWHVKTPTGCMADGFGVVSLALRVCCLRYLEVVLSPPQITLLVKTPTGGMADGFGVVSLALRVCCLRYLEVVLSPPQITLPGGGVATTETTVITSATTKTSIIRVTICRFS